MGDQDGSGGVGRGEHAVVEVRHIAFVGQVGDVQRHLHPVQHADIVECVAVAEVDGRVGAAALIVGVGVEALARVLALKGRARSRPSSG